MSDLPPIKAIELHEALVRIAEGLQAHVASVVSEHPEDKEGWPVIENPDLDQMIKAASDATWELSKICFAISMRGIEP